MGHMKGYKGYQGDIHIGAIIDENLIFDKVLGFGRPTGHETYANLGIHSEEIWQSGKIVPIGKSFL